MRFIELFAGVGGFRYGLTACNRQQQGDTTSSGCGDSLGGQSQQPDQPTQRGDYTCVWANEWDRYAASIYRYHWNDSTMFEGDIRAVDPTTIPDHDLLVVGFPCQSFSIAGKRGGFADVRGTMFFEICRIARACGTKYLLLENVKGLLNHQGGATFQTIISTLDELGYDCQWQVLNSKNYGVPQNRERVFIIANLRTEPRPQVFPLGETDSAYTGGDVANCLDANYHKGWLDHGQRTMVMAYSSSQRENHVEHRLKLGEANTLATQSGCSSGIKSATFVGQLVGDRDNRYWKESGIHPTLQANPQNNIPALNNIRRLTPTECERLQAFPDGWTQYGIDKQGKQVTISDTQRYKTMGNAVTTSVITAIGKVIMAHIQSEQGI